MKLRATNSTLVLVAVALAVGVELASGDTAEELAMTERTCWR
jgi:hypothetical protein